MEEERKSPTRAQQKGSSQAASRGGSPEGRWPFGRVQGRSSWWGLGQRPSLGARTTKREKDNKTIRKKIIPPPQGSRATSTAPPSRGQGQKPRRGSRGSAPAQQTTLWSRWRSPSLRPQTTWAARVPTRRMLTQARPEARNQGARRGWFPPTETFGSPGAGFGNLMLTAGGTMSFAIGSRELGGALPRTPPGTLSLDPTRGAAPGPRQRGP